MSEIVSHLIAFVVGVFTGAGAKYYADKYTDKRRAKESDVHIRKLFEDTASMMPDLIREMQEDLRKPESKVLREFIILSSKRVRFMGGGKKFMSYNEDEHQDLMHKVTLLENRGFIYDVTQSNIPKYRMTEEFVNYVLRAKFKGNKVKI